ncbi:hypothetical protein O3G_MSEX002892 [Manduca sexta]|uniref:Gustatory receptor 14 n=1 Tax=Manduca sexta TaxID=7130 RepID=A0A5K8B5Y9_MANSE|nr:hypothetical protein O3G_MSEX002892 [Manduca sexta]CUQ99355.1 TPA: Gustatory receptor 14 [Manduca sexta]
MAPKIYNMIPKIYNSKARSRCYEAILFILLLCGYNYNYFDKNMFYKITAKFYCLILVSVMVYTTFACRNTQNWPHIWLLLEYVFSALIILFYRTKMNLFLQKLKLIDMYLRINYRHYNWELWKIIGFTIVLWVLRIGHMYLYCAKDWCYDIFSIFLISQFSTIALDVNGVWRCAIFDIIRYRLKILRIRLEESPENNFYLYVNKNKTLKENKIRLMLFIYRTIADVLAMISPELDATVSITFYLEPTLLFVCGFLMLHTLQIILFLFTPFLIVEFYSIEVERILLFLIHKVIDETDPGTKVDAKLFIKYIQIRSFRYKIWRILRVNADLPFELINVCVNFVLVLRNFMHLY